MRSVGFDIQPQDRGACSLTSCSYCQNGEVNQRANNSVDNLTRCKRDMENAGAHGSGEDRDGNKVGREAGALAKRLGQTRGGQSAYGWRPGQKGVLHNTQSIFAKQRSDAQFMP